MKHKAVKVIHNIGQLLTMTDDNLGLIHDAALAMDGERIVWVGLDQELESKVDLTAAERIDAGGRVVLPGLVDCHTHSVFAGSRAHEFAMRVAGSSYEEILQAGGGIHATVAATRQADPEVLFQSGWQRLDRFLRFGVTTLEIKSGYGLDLDTELKMLRVANRLGQVHPVDVQATLLGAHVVPAEFKQDRAAYVRLVIERLIPTVADEGLARFCDVFCDQGAFDLDETRRILQAGKKHGLIPKLHGEQLSHLGSVELACDLDAASIDHLEYATAEDAARLARSNTVAVLLPGATYFLGKTRFADGRLLTDAGCRLAVSTHFNPGSSHTENLPLMLNMACLYNRIGPNHALLGATRWAAEALRVGDRVGTINAGVQADLLLLDTLDYRDFLYHFGVDLTRQVYKRGKLVVDNSGAGQIHG